VAAGGAHGLVVLVHRLGDLFVSFL
jgi:hypothetical protein